MIKDILLSWWTSLVLFEFFIIFVFLHNAMYGIFGIEEPIFFLLAIIVIIGFIVSVIVNFIQMIIKIIRREIRSYFKKQNLITYISAFIVFLIIILFFMNIFFPDSLGRFSSWIFPISFVAIISFSIIIYLSKEMKKDERMEQHSKSAIKITFIFSILLTIITMITDGINPIKIPISMFLIYFLTGMLVCYILTYKILLKIY